jgi:hypothetical protein
VTSTWGTAASMTATMIGPRAISWESHPHTETSLALDLGVPTEHLTGNVNDVARRRSRWSVAVALATPVAREP